MPLRVPGGSQRIDQIRVGDLVLSRDEHDPAGPVVAKVVEEVFVRQARVLHLHVRGQVIRTTAEHPFDAYDQGWTAAGQLREGDWLRTEAGDWAQVEEVFDTGETATVYNLRVADYHTYFVGCDEWGFSVWAHNAYDGAKQIGNDTVEGWARKWVAGHVDGKSPPLDLGAGRPTSKQWEGIRKWARANLQKEMADAGVPLPNNPGGGRGAVSTQELTGQWTDGLVAESQGRLLNGGGRSGGVARVERPLTGLDGRALSPDAHVLPTSGPMAGVEIYLQTVTVRGKTVNTLRDWERGNAVRLYEYGVNEGRPFEVVLIPKRDSGPFYRVVDGQIVEMPRPSNAQALLQQLAQLRAGG
jgi:hypothetical protein